MALFVVLSVFSGLREYSVQFTNDFDPDLKVNVIKGKSFSISDSQEKKLKELSDVQDFSKIVEERVLFYFDGKEQVTFLKGVDRNFPKISKISSSLYNGQWLKPNTYQAVVGYGISNKLSLALFDFNHQLEVFVPKPGKGQISSEEQGFNKEYLIPVGIYAISDEIDNKYVFVDLPLSQSLMGFDKNTVTGLEIKTKPDSDLDVVASEIAKVFDNKVAVKTRAELNATLHKMLNTENIAVYLIFTLVIIIALFNLIGALIMMILDKKDNLKTMLNLGTTITSIRKIFLFQGILISVLGGIVGLILGVIAVVVQQKFNLIMITDTLAYPVVFEIKNLLLVFVTISSLGFIASFIAGGRVSKNLLN